MDSKKDIEIISDLLNEEADKYKSIFLIAIHKNDDGYTYSTGDLPDSIDSLVGVMLEYEEIYEYICAAAEAAKKEKFGNINLN